MICPSCGATIAERDEYLMSVRPDAEVPLWGRQAMIFLVGLFVLALLFG